MQLVEGGGEALGGLEGAFLAFFNLIDVMCSLLAVCLIVHYLLSVVLCVQNTGEVL
jgi:hypothetical protein